MLRFHISKPVITINYKSPLVQTDAEVPDEACSCGPVAPDARPAPSSINALKRTNKLPKPQTTSFHRCFGVVRTSRVGKVRSDISILLCVNVRSECGKPLACRNIMCRTNVSTTCIHLLSAPQWGQPSVRCDGNSDHFVADAANGLPAITQP